MLTALAALLAAALTDPPADRPVLGRTAWIVATVGHSEWCPAGNVRLDLVTGRYQFTPGLLSHSACARSRTERPGRAGILGAARLAPLRAAFLRVLEEDVEKEACRNGRHPEEIVINNGGTPVLVLTTGTFTLSAPDDLACWSGAANDLQDALERAFPSRRPR